MYMQEARPPSTWSQFTNKRTIRDWSINLSSSLSPMQEVQPDPATVQSIQNAFLSTMGSKPQIFSITRIENIDLFQKYMDECQRLFKKAYANKKSFNPIHSLANSTKKNVVLEKYLHKGMTSQLYPEINEHYFFHGTNASVVPVIKSQGLDSRLAASGRVGAGVYGAEVASKSAQYVGPDQRGHCFMFIIRMCMGDVYVTQTGGGYRRAPCKTCFSDKCIKHYDLYDSIMADGAAFADREFLVYDKNQCYPEYLIEFSSQMHAPQMPMHIPPNMSSALGFLQKLQN
ncbi:hypothetical protein FSP39_004314 [Pinctada imbricata]|uniref:Poly [ADP-ribose] polymerase n=1 Tax=Pinctada imbricata TaxID=66713 RepID=A0AA88YDJ9_PINIB|nr:hypothetical protein FSP39_004314 [Pinctada imbricata]